MSEQNPLPSWHDGSARTAIVEFVSTVTKPGAGFVPPEERIATFDNDGTLWCEKPLPIQADFILRRLQEMAEADPELRSRQPWQAAYEHDYAWLGRVLAEHYAGDDTNVYTSGAERALELADRSSWTVVSIKDDWATVF